MIHLLHKQGLKDAARITAAFEKRGTQVTVLSSESPEHVAELLDGVAIDRLVVAGGDGMVHHAIQHLAGTEIELGVVPAGTGNDIARALRIPKRGGAIETALFPARSTDALSITDEAGNRSWVLSILTAGFSGTVSGKANDINWIGGQAKYTAATLMCLPSLTAHQVTGLEGHNTYSILAFANTRYFGGGMAICPRADPTDGAMEVVVVDDVHPLHLAAVLPAAFIGRHIHSGRVHQSNARSLTISTEAGWWADGEPLPQTGTVTIEIVPGALTIARPK